MATSNHKDLTGVSLHEPKGAAAASANTAYVADGAGSGAWEKIDVDSINTSSVKNVNLHALTYKFEDISTASSQWVVAPLAGDIQQIYTVIDGAIATADCGISFEIGGVAVTGGGVTVTQSGSAAGDVDSATPSGANTVTAGQAIEVISDGASTNAVDMTVTFLMDVA